MKKAKKTKNGFISAPLYKRIHASMPIACVDAIVVCGGEYLLVKRKDEPEKNEWWFPGGRILKGETFLHAAKRKIKEETGISATKVSILGAGETIFQTGPFRNPTHTVNIVVLAVLPKKQSVLLDNTSDEYEWRTNISRTLHPYLKSFLKKAKILKAKKHEKRLKNLHRRT